VVRQALQGVGLGTMLEEEEEEEELGNTCMATLM
jgi:hypothetical protein